MRVRLTLRDAGVDILLVGNKVVKRNLFICQRVDSDGAQGDLTELWKIFRQQVSGFVAVECDGEIGVDCILRRFTGVTVDAAGNIQREYSGDGRIDFFGDLAAAHIHLAVESAAVDGIDNHIHLLERFVDRLGLLLKGKNRQLHRAGKVQHTGGVIGFRLTFGQHDGDGSSLLGKLSGDDKAVPAVVSFSAENDAVQITDIVQRLKDEIGSRTAGVFHQAQVAHLILDRILLDLFHLFGGYDPHTVISFLY